MAKKQQTTWIAPALPATQAAGNVMTVATPKPTTDDVTVMVLQNAIGGVGVAGLTAMGAWWATGGDWQAAGMAAILGGFGVFCLALAVRAFVDEARIAARAVRTEWEARGAVATANAEWAEALEEAEGALVDALAEIDYWKALAESLRKERDVALAEAQQLRSQLNPAYRSAASLYENVRRDAKSLIRMAHDAGGWVGRDRADLQWSKDRWRQAQKLLQDAGVILVNGKQVRILLGEMDRAVDAIDRYTGLIGGASDDDEA